MSKIHEQLSPREKGQMIRMEELLANKKAAVDEIARVRSAQEAKEDARAGKKAARQAQATKDERVTVNETVQQMEKTAEMLGSLARKGGRRAAKTLKETGEKLSKSMENLPKSSEEAGKKLGKSAEEAGKLLGKSAEETGKLLRGKAERAGLRATRAAKSLGIDTDKVEREVRRAGRKAAAAADQVQNEAEKFVKSAEQATRRGRKKLEEAVSEVKKRGRDLMKANVTLQYQEMTLTSEEIEAKVREIASQDGVRINSLDIYVKPEERKAYYVVNGSRLGEVSL